MRTHADELKFVLDGVITKIDDSTSLAKATGITLNEILMTLGAIKEQLDEAKKSAASSAEKLKSANSQLQPLKTDTGKPPYEAGFVLTKNKTFMDFTSKFIINQMDAIDKLVAGIQRIIELDGATSTVKGNREAEEILKKYRDLL